LGQGWQHARECIMGRQRDVELAAHRSQHNILGVCKCKCVFIGPLKRY
jgi:hypothetical protein